MSQCPRITILCLLILIGLLSVGCRAGNGPIVDSLLEAQEQRTFVVPFSQNGYDLDEAQAYAQQDKYIKALTRDGTRKMVGYKIAYASDISRVRAGVSQPAFGQLLDTMQVPEGGSVVAAGYRRFAIEAEVAVVMGKTIDQPVETAEDMLAYVATVHAALDMPDLPFDYEASFTATDMIIANAAGHRFALGPSRDPLRIRFEAMPVILAIDGRAHSSADASDVMGGPYHALLWLQQQLVAQGKTLKQGQIVLTGAPARAFSQPGPMVDVAGTYSANIGPLGVVNVVVR